MQIRYVVGAVIVFGAMAAIAVVTYFGNQELYFTVDEFVQDRSLYPPTSPGGAPETTGDLPSELTGPHVQVRGDLDYESVEEGSDGLDWSFTLVGEASRLPVVYHGVVPDTFGRAGTVTARGRVRADGTFVADRLYTVCPSKYEAVPPDEEAAGSEASARG